jgi:hypothetical protein
LLFFAASGESIPVTSAEAAGNSNSGLPAERSIVIAPTIAPTRVAEVDHPGRLLDSPLDDVRQTQRTLLLSEQDRLQTVRGELADTIAQAMGVASLNDRLIEARNQLTAMTSASREVVVTAPVYGLIGDVRFLAGDEMRAGEILLRILHTDRRYVVVNLPTRRVTEMKSGQEVVLHFPGGQVFRGRVTAIPVLADADAGRQETVATVRIEPIGRHWPNVPIGSQVDVVTVR